jgi:hypothetical protein
VTTQFSQLDPAWSRKVLGNGPQTIRTAGCLLCAVASGLKDLDASWFNPGELNECLKLGGGFTADNGLIWSALNCLNVHMTDYINCRESQAPVEMIRKALSFGSVVLLEVDYTPGGKEDRHWVRALGMCGDDLTCMDPMQQPGHEEIGLLEHYGKAQGWDLARAIYFIVSLTRIGSKRP